MSSNAVVNEFVALEILEKNADDAHARAQRLGSPNVALKAKVSINNEEYEEEVEEEEDLRTNEEIKYDFNEFMALQTRAFWNKNKGSRPRDNSKFTSSATRPSGAKVRVCYNCGQNNHFIVDCPYERKEDHGGRLVRKDRAKFTPNKNKNFHNKNKNFNNKRGQQKKEYVLVHHEEWDSDASDDDEEGGDATVVAADRKSVV